MNTHTKSAILYLRVSDQKQVDQGHSLKAQDKDLRKLAASEGYTVLKVFTDAGKSGSKIAGRDEFEEAMAYIEEHPSMVDAFFVQDTSRLARDEWSHFVVRKFLEEHGVKLVSLMQPNLDDSPEGKLMDTLLAGMNAFHSRITARKVKNMMLNLAQQGKTPGAAPLGYKNVNLGTDKKPDKQVIVDEETSHFVTEAFDLFSSGQYTLIELAHHMNEKGMRSRNGMKLHHSTISHILTNPYYIGKIRFNGKEYNGVHPTFIQETTFQRCGNILAEHDRFSIRKRVPENHELFYAREFLKCGICGNNCTGTFVKKKGIGYYHCSSSTNQKIKHSKQGQMIEASKVDEFMLRMFEMIHLDESVVKGVLEKAKALLKSTHSGLDRECERTSQRIIKGKKRLQTLEVKLLDGVIDDEVYMSQHKAIEAEIRGDEVRLEDMSGKREANIDVFEKLLSLVKNLPEAFRKSNPENRILYLRIFWDSFTIKDRQIIELKPSKATSALIKEGHLKLKAKDVEEEVLISKIWCPREELNHHFILRTDLFYPLNYGGEALVF